jgi:hypothetical protein
LAGTSTRRSGQEIKERTGDEKRLDEREVADAKRRGIIYEDTRAGGGLRSGSH